MWRCHPGLENHRSEARQAPEQTGSLPITCTTSVLLWPAAPDVHCRHLASSCSWSCVSSLISALGLQLMIPAVRRQRSTQRAGMLLREQGVILPRTMLMLCGHPRSGPYGKRLQEKSLCRFDRAGVAAIRALKETGRRRKAKQAP